jgi:lysophospholipase L1-like esterase
MVAQLQQAAPGRPVVLALLAVDASSSEEWTATASPLRARLKVVAGQLLGAQFVPELVLWQQGEADARIGASTSSYKARLLDLKAHLQALGVAAPVVLAKSTVCRSKPSPPIRQAIDELVAAGAGFEMGPDTDGLVDRPDSNELRHDGCHFSALGQQRAAELWATRLLPQLRRR